MLFSNKLFNSIACLLSFTNLQLVIPGRTWILLYVGRTVYKRLWACLALYKYGIRYLPMAPGMHDPDAHRNLDGNYVSVLSYYQVTTRQTREHGARFCLGESPGFKSFDLC